jgi:hypothetical protein
MLDMVAFGLYCSQAIDGQYVARPRSPGLAAVSSQALQSLILILFEIPL